MFTDSEEQIIMFCEQLDIQLSCTDILNFKSIWSGKLNVKSVWSGKLNVYERPNPPGLAGTHNHELGRRRRRGRLWRRRRRAARVVRLFSRSQAIVRCRLNIAGVHRFPPTLFGAAVLAEVREKERWVGYHQVRESARLNKTVVVVVKRIYKSRYLRMLCSATRIQEDATLARSLSARRSPSSPPHTPC